MPPNPVPRAGIPSWKDRPSQVQIRRPLPHTPCPGGRSREMEGAQRLPGGWGLTWALASGHCPRLLSGWYPAPRHPRPGRDKSGRSSQGAPFLSREPGREGQGGARFQKPHPSRKPVLWEQLLPSQRRGPASEPREGRNSERPWTPHLPVSHTPTFHQWYPPANPASPPFPISRDAHHRPLP